MFPRVSGAVAALSLAWAGSAAITVAHADPILDVTKLYQNDPAWEAVKLDNSVRSIGEFGCTLTAWTMLFNHELGRVGLTEGGTTISYTPDQINTLLNNYRYTDPKTNTTYNGWSVALDADGKPTGSNTDINVGALRQAVEADTKARSDDKKGLVLKSYKHDQGVDAKKGTVVDQDFAPFKDALTHGDPVIVRVDGEDANGKRVPNGHTVLVIGIDDNGQWLIADPFNDPNHPVTTLSDPDYKNRVYSYGWGVFQGGGVSDPYAAPGPYDLAPSDLTDQTLNPQQYGESVYMASLGKVSPVPEPAAISLLMAGVGVVLWRGRGRGRRDGRQSLVGMAVCVSD